MSEPLKCPCCGQDIPYRMLTFGGSAPDPYEEARGERRRIWAERECRYEEQKQSGGERE